MMWHTRWPAALVASAFALGLSACAADGPDEPTSPAGTAEEVADLPDGAIRLRADTPEPYDDGRLMASNIWDDAIVLEFQGHGSVETADLTVGEQATLGEHSFELIEVWEDPVAEEAEDGGLESYAVVVPVE